ncbi:metallophosphoesterase family protein [Ureibacillus sp. MALMAid1270]|uniref:metallophosphoesterase family protein n=1 Tax=Ureibacillus sp. MALMAid1270 TaxID=3411629 RepID=UPI003BA71020
MDKVFAIGDIHGNYQLLENILEKWNPKEELLVFLGDYIDRGPDSLEVLRKVMDLTQNHGAVALSGNHEQLLLYWLMYTEKSSEFYFQEKVGGIATIHSFFPDMKENIIFSDVNVLELATKFKEQYSKEIEFIQQLKLYYQWNSYVFVHAGIDVQFEDFKQTKEETFYWIREEFHGTPHQAKETIVFGHTPTLNLNEDKGNQVWVSPCRKKVGIDGGVINENGQLHGVVFTKDSNELTVYAAQREKDVFSYKVTL